MAQQIQGGSSQGASYPEVPYPEASSLELPCPAEEAAVGEEETPGNCCAGFHSLAAVAPWKETRSDAAEGALPCREVASYPVEEIAGCTHFVESDCCGNGHPVGGVAAAVRSWTSSKMFL